MQRANKKRVLIVDNNEHILYAMQKTLESAGFDTHTTWSGYEALAQLKSKTFDALLVDDYLPDLHSHDFLSRVARLPMQPWIVVMQDPTSAVSNFQRYVALGASTVVRKDNPAAVCRAISSCCAVEPLTKV